MKRSESIKEIATALSKCQTTLNDVYKGAQSYGYKYAPLDAVYDEIRPKMTGCGLSLTHEKSYNKETDCVEVRSLLMHTSGEWLEYFGSLPFTKGKNNYQDAGSGFTYLERYQTSAIFAITSDEDNDGNNKAGEERKDTAVKKMTRFDFQEKIDKIDSVGAIESWENAHLNKAETALSKDDFELFKNYIKKVKDVFNPPS